MLIQCLVTEKDSLTTQIVKAEVKFTCFLLEHNLPTASADYVGTLFPSTFPDTKVAHYYKSATTIIICTRGPFAMVKALIQQKLSWTLLKRALEKFQVNSSA